MAKEHNICQSCGMPHAKDPGGGGTESNGIKSKTYCSLFLQGRGVHPTGHHRLTDAANRHQRAKKQGVADLPIVWLQLLVLVGIVRIRGPRGFY
jgi:hypothetical protein